MGEATTPPLALHRWDGRRVFSMELLESIAETPDSIVRPMVNVEQHALQQPSR